MTYGHRKLYMSKLIYLSGPIDYGDATAWQNTHVWRHRASYLLGEKHVLNPTRREYRGELSDEDVTQLVQADLEDIDKCGVLLANVWKFSAGTLMEMWRAFYSCNIRVVTVCPPELRKAWVRYVSEAIFDTVDESCDYIKENYLKATP